MEPISKTLAGYPRTTQDRRNTDLRLGLKNQKTKWIPSPAHIEDCQDRLERGGYAPDPHCQRCHGGGIVHPIKYDGSADYSSVIDCPAKNCIQASYSAYKRGDQHLAAIGVSPKKQTFDNFKMVAGVKETYHAFEDLATGKADYVMILSYGVTGNGKTHLCNALALGLTERGVDTKLYAVKGMMSELRASMNNNTTEDIVAKLKKGQALILDDYKPEHGSVWEMGRVEEIIKARYESALITVLTTNRNLDELPERIKSCFFDEALSVAIFNEGRDFRQRRR